MLAALRQAADLFAASAVRAMEYTNTGRPIQATVQPRPANDEKIIVTAHRAGHGW